LKPGFHNRDDAQEHAFGTAVAIKDINENPVGYSWQIENHIPFESSRYNHAEIKSSAFNNHLIEDVQEIHKKLHDHYNTNFNKNHISKNNPLIHDTIAFKKYADPDMMQYEGVGSVFGEGLGPQDASENITDVEEGPKGPSSTQHSTTELPGAQQGQQVIPGGGTSWFTASAYFNDDDYRYHNVNDSRKHQDYNLGLSDVNSIDDDSDTDDEDDYVDSESDFTNSIININ
jgi:hypothetical protein